MNALAAKDIEATDLLAGLDGDGSPGRCGPPWSTLTPCTGHDRNRARASRAEMIAAASGRARQQLMPALTGVG
jgi:hypothetical protein